MVFWTMFGLATLFTILGIAFGIVYMYYSRRSKIPQFTRFLNKNLAGRQELLVFQVTAYAAAFAWVALILPWIGWFTIGRGVDLAENGVVTTYFGSMPRAAANAYLLAAMMNILGAKAALKLEEMAAMLRRGPVFIERKGWWVVWHNQH